MTKKEELIHLILRMDRTKKAKVLEQMSEDDLIMMKVRMSMQSGRPEPRNSAKENHAMSGLRKAAKEGRRKSKFNGLMVH
jgi:hypothetical protein